VDLNPVTFTNSRAYGVGGGQQVGYAWNTSPDDNNAMLWTGTAASAVNLNPDGFTYSVAYGTNGSEQVGQAGSDAFLWNGTAASGVNLNPAGFGTSIAYGTNGSQQVGVAIGDTTTAMVWSGTAASAVNLGALLPFTADLSYAYEVDSSGNVFGIAMDSSNQFHAVEWSPVPEPGALALIAVGSLLLLKRERARE
jgi:hypothetical protein